jgi:hypothetical protein
MSGKKEALFDDVGFLWDSDITICITICRVDNTQSLLTFSSPFYIVFEGQKEKKVPYTDLSSYACCMRVSFRYKLVDDADQSPKIDINIGKLMWCNIYLYAAMK